MPCFVLDTNVVLDLFHFADPAALPILAALEDGRASCLANDATLTELARVLAYPEFGLSAEAGEALLGRYRALVRVVPVCEAPPLPRCKDPDDQKFLELAAGRADLLVSKDKALLRLKGRHSLGFRIVTPAEAGAALAQ